MQCLGSSPPSNECADAPNDSLGTWIPDTHVEDPDGLTGSRCQPGPFLTVAGIWGNKQWVEDLCLCLLVLQVNKKDKT